MERQSVNSSRVAEYGYDAETQTLEIAFPASGSSGVSRVYSYAPVPPETLEAMKASDSFGRAFGDLIIKAKIPYQRLNDTVLRERTEQ